VFDHSDGFVQLPSQTLGVIYPATCTVQNVVAAIRDERFCIAYHASFQRSDKTPQFPGSRGPTKRHDFYSDCTLHAEAVYQLGLVHHDDQVLAGAGDDLFA